MTPEHDPALDFSIEGMRSGPTVETAFRRVDHPEGGGHHYEHNGRRVWGVSELVESYGHSKPVNGYQEDYAQQGTSRHRWIELDMKGQLDLYDPPESETTRLTIAQAREARAYIGVQRVLAIEESNYVIVNTQDGPVTFGGTIDTLAELADGSRAIIDWKGPTRMKQYRLKLHLYGMIWPAEHLIAVHISGKPGWDVASQVDAYADPRDRQEAHRIIASAAWRDRRAPRVAWAPVKADDPDMTKCPF